MVWAGRRGDVGAYGPILSLEPLAARLLGWRGVFQGLAGLALAAALGVLSTLEKASTGPGEPLGQQLRALGGIVRSRFRPAAGCSPAVPRRLA